MVNTSYKATQQNILHFGLLLIMLLQYSANTREMWAVIRVCWI